jgi:hypothetical protein
MMIRSIQKRLRDNKGQAAIESMFTVVLLMLLFLASGEILYTSMIANEAVERAHRRALEEFRKMNANGSDLKAKYEEWVETVEVEPATLYAQIVNNWTLFHGAYMPSKTPKAKYDNGKKYKAVRSIYIAAGPLKGPGGVVESEGDGKSAFGKKKGGGSMPESDGDGWNNSGAALRNDAFEKLANELGIRNSYF